MSNDEKYVLVPWKQYKVCDNGVFAPKGSNPLFHTEHGNMTHDMNPLHPFVQGYIMHDQMKEDEFVPKRRIQIWNIDYENPVNPQP
jgi:hypothetical protein